MMKDRNYIEEIKEIVSGNNPSVKKELLEDYHESDIADVVEELTKEERIALYEILGDKRTAVVFSYLENVDEYVSELEYADAADIIEQMDADDAVDVLEELEEEDADKIIDLMDEEIIEDITLIQSYEDEEIGSKMSTNYIVIEYGDNVKKAMNSLIEQAAENDNVSTIFVVENNKFYGTIELRDLIIARADQNMDDIIKTSYPRVYDKTLIEDCINDLSDYQLDSIPVLDSDDKLIGVITLGDIVEAVEEELAEDYAKLGAVSEDEEISTGIIKTVMMRLPWLIALLFLSLMVSVLLSSFEAVIAVLPAIVFFQSMILGMAGNGGTQSLAVTIRTISDDKEDKTLVRAILKEGRVGFVNGLVLGGLSFVVILIFLVLKQQEIIQNNGYDFMDAVKAAGIVGSSLLVAMTFASLVGSIVPIALSKLKIDPAVASGPFITTINDILAIVIYYGLAYLLFINIF